MQNKPAFLRRVGNRLRQFRTARSGNVAITFALATLPIIGSVGAAVDYSRANAAKASMQGTVDAIALMLAKDVNSLTTGQLNGKAQSLFTDMFKKPDVSNATITTAYNATTSQLDVNASATMKTILLEVIGISQIAISTKSVIAIGGTGKLEVALVLDNTGSMAKNGKLQALINASSKFVKTMQSSSKKLGDIKIAIVPFDTHVNIGPGYSNESWIAWDLPPPTLEKEAGTSCPASADPPFVPPIGTDRYNEPNGHEVRIEDCIKELKENNVGKIKQRCPSIPTVVNANMCNAAKIGGVSNGDFYCKTPDWKTSGAWTDKGFCGWNTTVSTDYGDNVTSGRKDWDRSKDKTVWAGCVIDRTQPYDVQDTAPNANPDTWFPSENCILQEVLPLTYDWSKAQTTIDGMKAKGMTNITIGLVWGWHALSPGQPLIEGSASATNGAKKIVVLLTDGQNTQNRWTKTASEIDARTLSVCNNIKADKITLYTIRLIDGNASLLQSCATDPTKYYDVQNVAALTAVFEAIAKDVSSLRIAK